MPAGLPGVASGGGRAGRRGVARGGPLPAPGGVVVDAGRKLDCSDSVPTRSVIALLVRSPTAVMPSAPLRFGAPLMAGGEGAFGSASAAGSVIAGSDTDSALTLFCA